jgi:hypothetical protein
MYNDPNTSSTSTTRESAVPSHHTPGSSTKDTGLRQNVLDPQSDHTSRPPISENVSTASIRSGVVGAGQEPRNIEGTGFSDYATSGGSSVTQQALPVRSADTAGQSRPRPTQMETMDPSGFVNSSHAHRGLGHDYSGDPCPEGQEAPVPGYVHHQHGPHGTDIANRLDPHVPGEFPSDNGLESHERTRDGRLESSLGSGSSGIGSGAYTSEQRAAALPGQGMNTTDSTSGHHYGRDAALGAGAGAAGAGAYEYAQHQNNPIAKVADPNHDPLLEQQRLERERALETALHGGQRSQPDAYNNNASTVGSSTTDRSFPLSSHPTSATGSRDVPSETSRDHHLGRDAALVGGGLGAAGLGAHEAGSHRPSHEIEGYEDQRFDPSVASGDRPTRIPNLMYGNSNKSTHAGQQHTGGLPGQGVSSAETASGTQYGRESMPGHGVNAAETASGHHYGRDAALAGGAGAAGVGAYEYAQHRGQGVNAADTASGQQYGRESMPGHGVNASETASGQSYGRDAALAGGAGVAGSQMQGYNHGGRTETDPASKTTGPHKSNLMNIVDPRVQPEPEKMKDRTTTGPYQSDMMNRADPRVDSDLSKQNEHHYGRDAALVGGAGAAGAGAYEYGKHERGPTENIGTSAFDPRSTNTSNVVDPNHDPILEQQRLERQRAYETAMAGGVGGAGVGGAHELGSHHGTSTQSTLESPFASRSANNDPTLGQQQSGHHYGRDAALAGGAAGIGAGAYEHGRHNDGPAGAAVGTSTFDPRSTTTSNIVDPNTDPTLAQQQQGHHYGRDAALVGGAGAAGVGAHEYSKHHGSATGTNPGTSTFDPRSTNTANVVDPNHDPMLAQQRQERHHLGRDAAVAGGAGAAGYGAYEALDPKEQEKLAKHQAHEAEKAQKAQQHQMDKDLKHQQKEREHEIAKQEKAATKDHEHEQKKLAAAAAAAHEKDEKKHKHELEKAEKQREKEADRSEKEAEKATKENEHPEKKSHGLLGFLHRDKKHEPEADLRQQGRLQEADIAAHERHQRELEARAAEGSIPAAGASFEPPLHEQGGSSSLASGSGYNDIEERGHQTVSTDGSGRHRLHKDPPASVLKEREVDHPYGDSHGANVRIA